MRAVFGTVTVLLSVACVMSRIQKFVLVSVLLCADKTRDNVEVHDFFFKLYA